MMAEKGPPGGSGQAAGSGGTAVQDNSEAANYYGTGAFESQACELADAYSETEISDFLKGANNEILFAQRIGDQTTIDEREAQRRLYEAALELKKNGRADPAPVVPAPQPKARPSYPLTDTGNAERLAHLYGRKIRYSYSQKRWYTWTGKLWLPDAQAEVERYAKSTARYIHVEAATCKDDTTYKALTAWIKASESKAGRMAMLTLATSEPGIEVKAEELDRDPWLLNCQNGVVDLRTGELLAHDPARLITKIVPVAYDAAVECPLFERFLSQVFAGDSELMRFVKRAVGYSLTGSTRERVLLVCHGSGKNGKTTLLRLLRDLLADYGLRIATSTLMLQKRNAGAATPDVVALRGARFVYASETEQGHKLAESFIKDLTGSDPLSGRALYQGQTEFTPQCKVWLATNHKPAIRGTDNAVWDRIRLIPFLVRFEGSADDKELPEKLRAEWPGILRWAVEGCLEWQRDGLGLPPAVKKATEAYRAEQDVLTGFLDECTVSESGAKVTAKDIYSAYTAWAEANGEKAESQKAFGGYLVERGYEHEPKRAGYVWYGLRLRKSDDPVNHANDCEPKNTKVQADFSHVEGLPFFGSHGSHGSQSPRAIGTLGAVKGQEYAVTGARWDKIDGWLYTLEGQSGEFILDAPVTIEPAPPAVEPFVPSAEWQDLPPGWGEDTDKPLPAGGEYDMHFDGPRRARWPGMAPMPPVKPLTGDVPEGLQVNLEAGRAGGKG